MINDNVKNIEIVHWDDKYSTGIELIDSQHKKLFEMTNNLFLACKSGEKMLTAAFHEAMHKMVEYVHFHFSAELKLLHKINYPNYNEHKKMHDDLIHEILTASKDFSEGKKFVPNHFIKTLRDWILSHIAIHDKSYAVFYAEQKKNGVITDNVLDDLG